MIQSIKDMFDSKKFLSFVGGSVACAILAYFHAPDALIQMIGTMTGCYVVGQGMADFGKNKPR